MDAIAVIVNGKQYHVMAPPDMPLLWVLREHLQLTGTHYGCGEGQSWRLHGPIRRFRRTVMPHPAFRCRGQEDCHH